MALQVVLTPTKASLNPPRLLPTPPMYKLNGPSFGRPDVDLMFAKWAFNNVHVGFVPALLCLVLQRPDLFIAAFLHAVPYTSCKAVYGSADF